MQYILTEAEYNDLLDRAKKCKDTQKKWTFELCQRVADNMPIRWSWGGGAKIPQPWGCIHTTDDEWYCDECPVQEVCPGQKEYSK